MSARRAARCFGFLAALCAGAQALTFPPRQAGGFSFRGGEFPDTAFGDVAYVGTEFLDSLLGATGRWQPDSRQWRWRDAHGREWIFTLDNPFASMGGEVFNLTYPMRRGPEKFYLPLHPLLRILKERYGFDLGPAGIKPRKAVDSGNVSGIEIEKHENATLILVHTRKTLGWQAEASPGRRSLLLAEGRLSPACPRKLAGKGRVKSVSATVESGGLRISLLLEDRTDSVDIVAEPNLP